jgi:hypothetical protein
MISYNLHHRPKNLLQFWLGSVVLLLLNNCQEGCCEIPPY